MQISSIFVIVLLTPISTANEIKCEGDRIELSCLQSSSKHKGNALWKKSSGERVIWNYYGDSNKGGSFTNRTVKLNDDFSLSIEGCAQSDQGIYILCINGEPQCEITLFVKASKQCIKPETPTAQSTSPTTYEMSRQDATNESSLPTAYRKRGVIVGVCLFLVVLLLAVGVCIKRTESKIEKPEFKQLNTDTQNNKV